MSSRISFVRSSASRNSRSAWNQNSSSLPTGRLFSSQISLARFRIFSSLGFAKARALCFSSAVRANMHWTVSRSPTHRAKSRYFWPSREGGRPSASDPPYLLHQIRRRRFEFVAWIRGIKASTGARSWRAHLRAFCGKPALAGTAHPRALTSDPRGLSQEPTAMH